MSDEASAFAFSEGVWASLSLQLAQQRAQEQALQQAHYSNVRSHAQFVPQQIGAGAYPGVCTGKEEKNSTRCWRLCCKEP